MAIDNSEFKEIINTKTMTCYQKYGTIFDKKSIPLVKTKHIFGKVSEPFSIVELMNSRRTEWDKNIEIRTEVTKISNEVSIIYTGLKSPSIFIQPRDMLEKRIQFIDNNYYYAYFSSVPDSLYPIDKKFCRCDCLFSVNVIGVENGETVFYSFAQTDLKGPNLPQAIILPFFKSATQSFHYF